MSEPASPVPVPLRSAGLRGLLEYWEGRRGERRMPARADIDPAEFRPLIGRVSHGHLTSKPQSKETYFPRRALTEPKALNR